MGTYDLATLRPGDVLRVRDGMGTTKALYLGPGKSGLLCRKYCRRRKRWGKSVKRIFLENIVAGPLNRAASDPTNPSLPVPERSFMCPRCHGTMVPQRRKRGRQIGLVCLNCGHFVRGDEPQPPVLPDENS